MKKMRKMIVTIICTHKDKDNRQLRARITIGYREQEKRLTGGREQQHFLLADLFAVDDNVIELRRLLREHQVPATRNDNAHQQLDAVEEESADIDERTRHMKGISRQLDAQNASKTAATYNKKKNTTAVASR